MTRTDESLGGAVNFARTSSADARFSRAKTAFMISRSRRVRRSVAGFGICDSCRILDATHVACQPGPGTRQVQSAGQRKLKMLDVAARLEDLESPPGNRLKVLKGPMKGRHSIRVHEQYRVTFRWENGHA